MTPFHIHNDVALVAFGTLRVHREFEQTLHYLQEYLSDFPTARLSQIPKDLELWISVSRYLLFQVLSAIDWQKYDRDLGDLD